MAYQYPSKDEILAEARKIPPLAWRKMKEETESYKEAYEQQYGEEASVWAAIGYDAAYLAALGVVNSPSDKAADVEKTIREQAASYDGVTGTIEFDEDGVRTNPDVGFFKQIDGKLVTVDENGEPVPEG